MLQNLDPKSLVAGGALRLAGLTVSALWYDEAFSVVMARLDLFDMVRALRNNISPPGWEIVVWFTTRLWGWNEFGARIASLLASLIGMWVAFHLTQALRLSPVQQVSAMVLVTLLPYQFWMAQDGRVYAIYSLLYALAILWTLEGRWLGLTAALGLMLWCHNTAVLYMPAIGLLALLVHRCEWKRIIAVFVLAVAAWLPWMMIVLGQIHLGRLALTTTADLLPLTWNMVLGSLLTSFFARTLPTAWTVIAIIVFVITVVLLILDPFLNWIAFQMKSDLASGQTFFSLLVRRLIGQLVVVTPANSQKLLAWLVIIPMGLFVLAKMTGQSVILYRTLSPLVIPFALWFGFALSLRWMKAANWFLAVAGVCLLAVALAGWSPASKGSNLFQVRDMLRAKWQPGDIIYHATGMTAVVFWYYLPDQAHYLLDEKNAIAQDVAQMAQMNTPQVPLEKIPHRRAWVVWTRDEITPLIDPHIDERMSAYVKGCPLVGALPYWQFPLTEIYLCAN